MQNVRNVIVVLLILIFNEGAINATNYYCDPTLGNINNEGTANNPWSTLSDVFNEDKEFVFGDSIFLLDGKHGDVLVNDNNTDYVVITAVDNNTPILSSLVINNASFWKFKGLDIARKAPESNYNVYSVADEYFLVQSDKKSSNLWFDGCNIYTEGVDVNNWTRNDWYTGTLSGMILRSKYTKIERCIIKNTNFSLEVHGRYTDFTNSTIENFVGDAIRALSSYSSYEYNTVKNSYDITGYDDNSNGSNPDYPIGKGNHDDLFQSYTSSVGGTEFTVTDVIVRYNKLYSYTDINQVDKSYTQGIALFDGFFNNWIIENNLVVTDSWHGITMLGVNNAVITSNTLLTNPIHNDLVLGNGAAVNNMTPFIWVGETKSGDESYDNTIRNNLIIQSKFGASNYKNIIDEAVNTIVQNNHTIPSFSEESYFVDYQKFDMNTQMNSPAIDQGININISEYDLNAKNRLMGTAVDCGAYEFDNSSEGNNCPVIDPVDNHKVKQFESLEIKIVATDTDESPIYLKASELPEFITFADNGDGTAMFNVSPLKDDLGEYDVSVTASDEMGNSNLQSFLIEVEYGEATSIIQEQMELKLFPNPVRLGAVIQVSVPESIISNSANVDVFDTNGRNVISSRPIFIDNVLQLNTTDIKEIGFYIISYNGYNNTISIQ